MRVSDIKSIQIKLASPEEILSWSHGEVLKPETINYRTQRAEKDGLFCERIFGPEKDYECYCGKYKRIRYKGVICDKCGVEITKSSVRRKRMGHIKLATPVSHIWFLRGMPSRMGLVLDIPAQQLEKIIYFAAYIVTKVDEGARKKVLQDIEKEFKSKSKNNKKKELQELKQAKDAAREEVSGIKKLRILTEVEYLDLSLKYGEVFDAGTGAETLRKIFEEIDLSKLLKGLEKDSEQTSLIARRKILKRLKAIQKITGAKIKPEWMFVTILPVLPPDLRPMVQLDGGRYASSDLNDLYRRIINRNNRLKYLLEINAPEVIIRNEKRMLQEAVDALIDNQMRKGTTSTATTGGRRLLKSLADMLQGKQGRFRQNLLGKRVDYSGRSVIVVGPELGLNQCGLPKKMALELFKPFVIKRLLDKEFAYNVRGASKLVEEKTPEVWAILEEIIKEKKVLLNRAPTLHRLGIQAFQPVLIEGEAIKIHPMVCRAFNADFDGDQMAVHVPLSEKSQKEAREIMLSSLNLLKPASGVPVTVPTQDIILGCYFLTGENQGDKGNKGVKVFSSAEEAIMAYELEQVGLREKIKIPNPDLIETTVGRVIFNEALPKDYAFVNTQMNSKELEKVVNEIVENYGYDESQKTLDKIKEIGFEYSSRSAITWGIDDLEIPKEKEKLIEQAKTKVEKIQGHFKKGLLSKREKTTQVIEVWQRAKTELEKLVPQALPKGGSVFSLVDSGAKGSWSQPIQMAGMKGLVINPGGQIIELPVKSCFKEGLDVLEFFISTHGARKGTADTALRTSTAGYLTRRLIDVAHEVIISQKDCGDKKGLILYRKDAEKMRQNFLFKILGRVVLEDIKGIVKKGEIIDWQKANKIIKAEIKQVQVRSPLSCKTSRGICQKCYGWDLGKGKLIELGGTVGIVAAQAIGEPGTQLTMRTFHTGGVAGEEDITLGLPRIEEIFETRSPKREAIIALKQGKVTKVDKKEGVIEVKSQAPNPKFQASTKPQIPKTQKKKKTESIVYKISGKDIVLVEKGQEVKAGEFLTDGSSDLKKLFQVKGQRETERYIVKEVQNIYVSQGAVIHDKHIEVIVRQMFSRVKIKDEGDSPWVSGTIVEKALFQEENQKLKTAGKKTATAQTILFGVSKVALTTDSFLSAASFQETSRVLINAALEGKEDKLLGLKENVIIGKLIPAGTGFKK
ncbi:DNA-directed RNA polymerase subunit beta' [Parcubacteria bacterium DG_74_2]|nr:MAG: DNA-directed RNA polymerase subunit beta' [Parcubacteria bacterium DG_74_2]